MPFVFADGVSKTTSISQPSSRWSRLIPVEEARRLKVRDIVFLAIMLAFFALCVVIVRACDQMIGTDDVEILGATGEPQDERTAA